MNKLLKPNDQKKTVDMYASIHREHVIAINNILYFCYLILIKCYYRTFKMSL